MPTERLFHSIFAGKNPYRAEQLITPLAEATQALDRLHGIGPRAGSREILIEPFIRKEALESSQIEGTHATLSDIYAYEAGQEVLIDEDRQQDAQEVSDLLAETVESASVGGLIVHLGDHIPMPFRII